MFESRIYNFFLSREVTDFIVDILVHAILFFYSYMVGFKMAENWRCFKGNQKGESTDGRKRRLGNTDERSSGAKFEGFTVR